MITTRNVTATWTRGRAGDVAESQMFAMGELNVVATAIASTAIIFILLWIKRSGTKDADKRHPPSASTLSLIIAILRGGMSVLPDHFMKTADKLGPVISYKLGGSLVIILNGKEAITEAFLRNSEAFADRPELWTEANVFNRDLRGIAAARYNTTFKKYHKLCLTILKEFGFGVNSVSETRILSEVEALNEEILKLDGSPFDPKPLTVRSTFNVVSSILFGKTFATSAKCKALADSIREFSKHADFATFIAPILRFVPYFRGEIAIQLQHHKDMINGINEGIECSRSTECELTFVRRFTEIEGGGYDRQDLLYILRDLCVGSAETVSTTLQWAFVELANHPEIQTRLHDELDGVVVKDRFPSLDDKPQLPYTEAVVLEVYRRHTAVPVFIPHATFKDVEIYGSHIPKGCVVFANAVSAHMDPESWKDPENFRPERFLDENNMIIASDKVIPFSLGKRSCLGEILGRQKTFLFLASLVQRFEIRPPEGQASIAVKEIIGGAMHPSDFKVRLIPRGTLSN